MTPLLALLVALVAEDGVALRSNPSDSAPAQATLYRGDWLEVRGEVVGFLKVWDHRRERPGFVRASLVRVHRAEEGSAAELAAIVRFLREARGFESLGVGYAALYLRIATPARRGAAWGEVLGAMGAMADRLARRGSQSTSSGVGGLVAAHLDVIESYGIKLRRFEVPDSEGTGRNQRTAICYDGDAFARVLAMSEARPRERAEAGLALTRRGCLPPTSTAADRRTWNDARLVVLGEIDPGRAPFLDLPRPLAHRVRLRTAEALSERVHTAALGGDEAQAVQAATLALRLLALVDRGELGDEERPSYEETAVRVAAVRWLAEPGGKPPGRANVRVQISPRQAGQSCVRLLAVVAQTPTTAPLAERCTFGIVFPGSIVHAPADRALAVAVAPLPGWTELWIFRPSPGGWQVEVVPPPVGTPGEDVGYVELAGFAPDGAQVLVARELCGASQSRRFEVIGEGGATLRWASRPERLRAFGRWATPSWRRSTLSLR